MTASGGDVGKRSECADYRPGGTVILIGFAAALAYPALQVDALRRMRGVWRVLAAVPLRFPCCRWATF
jgi:hypothetical protein